jgi:hypothetical protein
MRKAHDWKRSKISMLEVEAVSQSWSQYCFIYEKKYHDHLMYRQHKLSACVIVTQSQKESSGKSCGMAKPEYLEDILPVRALRLTPFLIQYGRRDPSR